jgi:hypothetical protein
MTTSTIPTQLRYEWDGQHFQVFFSTRNDGIEYLRDLWDTMTAGENPAPYTERALLDHLRDNGLDFTLDLIQFETPEKIA